MFLDQKPDPPKMHKTPLKYKLPVHFSKAKLSSYPLPPYITQTYLHLSLITTIFQTLQTKLIYYFCNK